MTEVTLRFTVPATARTTFDHEIGLALDAMEPMRLWLERLGGRVLIDGRPVA